jgi:hypothetical protein
MYESSRNENRPQNRKSTVSIASAIAIFGVLAAASPALAAESETLALQFLGTADAAPWDALSPEVSIEIADLVDIDDLEGFSCFELDLVDPASGVVVGIGVDCLAPTPVGPAGNIFDAIEVEAFSFFMLPGGSFVSNGLTSVRAFVPGIGDAGGAFTHVTGSLPDGNNIIGANGQFVDEGSVRVSGAVDLSGFAPTISFNCLWIVQIEMNDE